MSIENVQLIRKHLKASDEGLYEAGWLIAQILKSRSYLKEYPSFNSFALLELGITGARARIYARVSQRFSKQVVLRVSMSKAGELVKVPTNKLAPLVEKAPTMTLNELKATVRGLSPLARTEPRPARKENGPFELSAFEIKFLKMLARLHKKTAKVSHGSTREVLRSVLLADFNFHYETLSGDELKFRPKQTLEQCMEQALVAAASAPTWNPRRLKKTG